jgi:fatty-acyl-CoA synthase
VNVERPATTETPSRVSGPTDQPLLERTIGEALDHAVSEWGDRDALISRHQGVRWTYRELGEAVDAVARGLTALDLEPDDRIGIWSPNNAEWVVTQFATAKAGLILVNVNPAYRLAELEYALDKVECKALVLADRFKSSDYVGMIRALAPEIDDCEPGALRSAKLPSLRTVVVIGDEPRAGFLQFADLPGLARPDAQEILERRQRVMRPEDPINVQFTSGTTGFPKGATLTHRNILNSAFFTSEPLRFTPDDRLCIPVPLYHCFGMVISVLGCVTHGAAMVFPSARFEPGAVLEAVAAERCTALHGVPTMFIAELEHPDFGSFDLSSLRTGIMAGAPCPIEVMRRVVVDMNMSEVTIAYGMTETSPTSFQSAVDDPIERRVSTVGRVHPHVEGKVVDEQGQVVSRGRSGELCTRGYNVMRGYWGDDELTREAVDVEGWMHTGDLATIDAEGYCNIVGRVKDMIIRGGENVYPREIEEFLYRHPKIQDVAVFGVPDDKFGEQIAAWVQPREGERLTADEVREFCKGQIAHFKIPAYVRFVTEFPMTVTGKVQKFVMRDRMAEELGAAERASA